MALNSVILFTKSFEKRLLEFRTVLCSQEHSVPANRIAWQWSDYAEIVLEPVGWHAVWKVPQKTCNSFLVKFPTYVVVYVESVNFEKLSASVIVVSTEGNISIPEKHDVDLKHLYPKIVQENSALNIKQTADCIDQLRFFYDHIWYPWDLDDTEDADWASLHLEPRLNLHFEMENKKNFPQKLASQIYNKIQKSHKLYERKKELEDTLTEREMSGKDFDENILSPSTHSSGYELLQIHLELNSLKTELQLIENPTMRTLTISQFLQEEAKNSTSVKYVLVWQRGSIEMMQAFVDHAELVVGPSASIWLAPSLDAAMEKASAGESVLLGTGIHKFCGRIEVSVTIKGVGTKNVYIQQLESSSYLLSVHTKPVVLENLCLDVRNVRGGILVRKNTEVHLVNCRLTGENTRDTIGITVLAGGSVYLNRCEFISLHIAIHCCAGSNVIVTDSSIMCCQDGLKVHEDACLKMEGGSLKTCKNAGIVYIGKNVGDQIGNTSLLDIQKDVHIKNVKLTDNRYDVEMQSQLQ